MDITNWDSRFKRAARWLEEHASPIYVIALDRKGYAEFVAYIYRLRREAPQTDIFYVVDLCNERIRRMCRY